MAQDSAGRAHGPMTAEGVVERLAKGVLVFDSPVAREGQGFAPLCEHVDFQSVYLPGTDLNTYLLKHHAEATLVQKSLDGRRRLRWVFGAACLAGAGLFGAWTFLSGGLVMPEAWAVWVATRLTEATDAVGSQVEMAVDQEAAARTVRAEQGLPGEPEVAILRAKYADFDGAVGHAIVEGRTALWVRDEASIDLARQRFGQAVARSPRDPEAVGGLVEVLAHDLERNPEAVSMMSAMEERLAAIDAESAPALRARAVASLASGAHDKASNLAHSCVALSPDPGLADPDCLLVAGVANNDPAILDALAVRLPDRFPVVAAQAAVAGALADWSSLAVYADQLVVLRPEDATSHGLAMTAHLEVGNWSAARRSAARVGALDVDRLDALHLAGQILLKVERDPKGALVEFDQAREREAIESYDSRADLLADAAEAARELGEVERARGLAQESLEVAAGHPAASLVLAKLDFQEGKREGAEAALKDVEFDDWPARSQARFLVGAARIHRGLDRDRSATSELEQAIEADPGWTEAHLESARLQLTLGNVSGALETLRELGLRDPALEASRTPLIGVWYPPQDWTPFLLELQEALQGDLRLQPETPEVLGLLAFATRAPQARGLLRKAVSEREGLVSAHGALATLEVEAGSWDQVMEHTEVVLASRPGDSRFHALSGRALQGLEQPDAAEEYFRKAVRGDDPSQSTLMVVAEGRAEAGDIEGALEQLLRILAEDPNHVEAQALRLALTSGDR